MRTHGNIRDYFRRIAAVILCLIITAVLFLPIAAFAAEAKKTVRVGWYETPFNQTDQFGRRSGYAYEYQRKIAAYTDWEYEYVVASWPELLQMLIDGEVDLMSDISYTEERSELMLFSSYPMGTEEYYLFVAPDNTEYSIDSYAWLNGKNVGINKGSVMIGMFSEWQDKNGTSANVVELTCDEEETIEMLHRGELDAYVILDAYGGSNKSIPVAKIGSSDFFFAVRNDRPDLLEDLNSAMNRINDENRFYNQQLYDKYVSSSGANVFLTVDETKWLAGHGPVRVAYQDDFLSFCDKDDETGELTGALKEYLDHASECFENARLEFEPVAYPTAQAAMDALKKGEADCMFPSNMSTSDCEDWGFVMTPTMMKTEIYAVVRKADQSAFAGKDHVITAVIKGDPNYSAIVMDLSPNGKRSVIRTSTRVWKL